MEYKWCDRKFIQSKPVFYLQKLKAPITVVENNNDDSVDVERRVLLGTSEFSVVDSLVQGFGHA